MSTLSRSQFLGSLQRKMMFDIVRRKNMALRDLGELPIREHTSAPVGKQTKEQMIASFPYAFERKVDVVDSVPGCNESASPHLD